MQNQVQNIIHTNGMNIIILKNRRNFEITEVDNEDKRVFGMSIELYKPGYSDVEHTKYEISVPSLGTADVEKATRYRTLLNIAIKLATKENKLIN